MNANDSPALPERQDSDFGSRRLTARKDYVDLRDQVYQPSLSVLRPEQWPEQRLFDTSTPCCLAFGVRDQHDREDCVGQALATLIDIQMRLQSRDPAGAGVLGNGEAVSASMIYSMARYHDAFGDLHEDEAARAAAGANRDGGVRTLRAAIKAFYHHGACLARGGDGESVWADDGDGMSRDWPTAAQAESAENRALGAYYRLLPILNHYHAALRDTETILVSARTHAGWDRGRVQENGGVIPWDPDAGDEGGHAFLIVGYTREGFLVLNSWGPAWGCLPGPDRRPLAGIALWTYRDWAANLLDGWVLRLGISGAQAFPFGIDEQGARASAVRSLGAAAVGSVPQRELRGRFLNLEDGALVGSGLYATPEAALHEFNDTMAALVADPGTRGIVLRFPGFLEPLKSGFQRAAVLHRDYARHGLETANFFWSANFAEQILGIVEETVRTQQQTAGGTPEMLDRRIEVALGGLGRACWRDICASARRAVFDLDGPQNEGPKPGKLAEAVIAIAQACKAKRKPIHILAEGAGAIVVKELVALPDEIEAREALLDALQSVTLVFGTIPLDDAADLIRAMDRLKPAKGKAAGIIVPGRALEKALSFAGYGKSVNWLMANAFADRRRGHPRPMLGMSLASMKTLARRMFDDDNPANPYERQQEEAMPDLRAAVERMAIEVSLRRTTETMQGGQFVTSDPGVEEAVKKLILGVPSKEADRGREDKAEPAPAEAATGHAH